MMLGTSKIVAFAAIRDRDAARKFYRDTLGLRLMGEDQFAMVFDAMGQRCAYSGAGLDAAPIYGAGLGGAGYRETVKELRAPESSSSVIPG